MEVSIGYLKIYENSNDFKNQEPTVDTTDVTLPECNNYELREYLDDMWAKVKPVWEKQEIERKAARERALRDQKENFEKHCYQKYGKHWRKILGIK